MVYVRKYQHLALPRTWGKGPPPTREVGVMLSKELGLREAKAWPNQA
jgi:hypothetical protein